MRPGPIFSLAVHGLSFRLILVHVFVFSAMQWWGADARGKFICVCTGNSPNLSVVIFVRQTAGLSAQGRVRFPPMEIFTSFWVRLPER